MGENLITDVSNIDAVDMQSIRSFRSRLKELSASLDDVLSSSGDLIPEPNSLLEDFSRNVLALSVDHDVEALGPADLEAFIEQLKKDLKSTEEENVKLSGEIDTLQTQVSSDSTKLGGDIDALLSLLNFIDSKVLELIQQIETSRSQLNTLEDLHHALKRLETICSLEDLFCGVKCIEFEDNCIRLSLRTPIPSMDSLSIQKKLDCSLERTALDHELLIEVNDQMELKNIEIFPGDVYLDGIINAVKSSRFLLTHAAEDILGWLLRQIQQRIILCNVRRLLVKNESSSRRSIVYSDPDEIITTHLEGGLVASVKMSQGWPLSSYPLMLWSLKHSSDHSKSIPWNLLCEVQEQANSLEVHLRQDLTHFVDAIERLVMEMQAKYSNSNASF
ncbi:hypothetical protein MA16_Dca007897 [Dendrobium catenatum]|uniref:Uncharacterized protein n=1 Tax=Dendrobium catenatum TaxID=906689 RepID=A0A2I0XJ73_9ASPA|nr:hypothetical protein MA16_Dca007897 [Dendrobium catenatum]